MAANNSQILRCHALVWHSQLAPWVEAKTDWTPDSLRAAIVRHVSTVAAHWRGRCTHWDVVNEALNEDGTYRESVFYRVLGEEYIKLAFVEAAKADPEAKLYYNDYNLESVGPKSEGARRIVRMLKDEGIKIDGVGMQAHLIAHNAPSLDQQIAVIESYAEEGVEVAITELDVRLQLPANATNLEQQKQVYKNVSFFFLLSGCLGCRILEPRLTSSRPSVLASRSRPASASPSGICTTPSAGCPTCSRERAPLSCGLRTFPSTLPTTVWLRL